MVSKSLWIVLFVAVACGAGNGAEEAATAKAAQSSKRVVASQEAAGGIGAGNQEQRDAPGDPGAPRPAALAAENPAAVVIALIEAFQAGDRTRVEALWAADGGTWTDEAGFRERAAYYQRAEFELDPAKISSRDDHGTTFVAVAASENGQAYIWTFLVSEIDGSLRAGGAEARLAGTP